MTSPTWKQIMFYAAFAKAAVVGTSLGLAAFGAMDFAFAISASDWFETTRQEYLFDYFALGGGLAGIVWQFISRV